MGLETCSVVKITEKERRRGEGGREGGREKRRGEERRGGEEERKGEEKKRKPGWW
jgi:hypothetical protein